jgi:hypothetical protein
MRVPINLRNYQVAKLLTLKINIGQKPKKILRKIKIKQKDISKSKTWFQRKKGVPEKFEKISSQKVKVYF